MATGHDGNISSSEDTGHSTDDDEVFEEVNPSRGRHRYPRRTASRGSKISSCGATGIQTDNDEMPEVVGPTGKREPVELGEDLVGVDRERVCERERGWAW